MSMELSKPVEILNPVSGEVLTLDAGSDDLARFVADVREYEGLLREAKRLVSRELLARMDKQASWTIRAGDLLVKGSSPQPSEEFDALALRGALLELVDMGELSVEAVDKAVEPVVEYKVRKAGLNALRKLGGRVAELIGEHGREVEKDRYVTVTRA